MRDNLRGGLHENVTPFLSEKEKIMPDFKGFDDWIPIFKGGEQRDNQGRLHDGDALIDKAISMFGLNQHEAPIVIGHPKNNDPAFGWVKDLKKIGNVLYAKFKDVVPEFENLVKRGLFKKRSASFYPDGSIRHVGFLGAIPPAVKGLADLKFAEGEKIMNFEFDESKDPGEFLHQKILELMNNPPEFSDEGIKLDGPITYSKAFTIVSKRYPETTEKYLKMVRS